MNRSDPTGQPTWIRVGDADQTIEENWLFRLRRERYRSRHSGKIHDYYVVHLADAVNVIARTPDRQLILVEQFRAGSGADSLEPPGGLVDENESPMVAGPRELLEETGYQGDPPVLISTVWSNPSIMTSRITTIFINNARFIAEPTLDPEEEVHVQLVPESEVLRMIQDGRISHALAVQGLLCWLLGRVPHSGLFQEDMSK